MAERSRSPSCSSRLPSWATSSTSISSSSWVILRRSSPLNSRLSSFFHWANRKLTGVITQISTRMTGVESMANFSGFSLARLLGEISPKISTTTVITMVDTVAPMSGSSPKNSRVEMEEAARFTTLLPTSMVDSSRS